MQWANMSSSKAKQDLILYSRRANGEPIGKSEVYSSEAAAKNGIESIKKNAPIAQMEDQTVEGWKNMTNPVFELYKDKAGRIPFPSSARRMANRSSHPKGIRQRLPPSAASRALRKTRIPKSSSNKPEPYNVPSTVEQCGGI